jgi:hypothetical protein
MCAACLIFVFARFPSVRRTPEKLNHDGARPGSADRARGRFEVRGAGSTFAVAVPAVEVVPVLDPNEKSVFDGMVSQLRDEDPNFLRKIERLGRRPRRNLRVAMAVLLWTLAPVSIALGGWTGLLMAVIAGGYGMSLVAKRDGQGRQPVWGASPHRHPGAPL